MGEPEAVAAAVPEAAGGGSSEAMDALEAHKVEMKQLKKRLHKYATLLQQAQQNPQEGGDAAKVGVRRCFRKARQPCMQAAVWNCGTCVLSGQTCWVHSYVVLCTAATLADRLSLSGACCAGPPVCSCSAGWTG